MIGRICALSALFCAAALGQSLEAASIKPAAQSGSRRMQGGPGTSDPSRIRYSALSLRYLVMAAYRIGSFQLSGPAWLDGNTFDVDATLPPGATKAQLREMLQTLLTERFRLAFHHEQKVMPIYTLTVAKGGPQLKPSAEKAAATTGDDFNPLPPGPPDELELDSDGYPRVPPREGSWLVALRNGHARMRQLNASMKDLAGMLSKQLGRPVTDATGLQGRYEFTLTWLTGVAADGASAEVGPDLATALRQQLGLKLETSKGPVEVLVIDHLERDPIGN